MKERRKGAEAAATVTVWTANTDTLIAMYTHTVILMMLPEVTVK